MAYKVTISKKKRIRKTDFIYKEMRQIFSAIRSWDMYEFADHSKDKKHFKKKKK